MPGSYPANPLMLPPATHSLMPPSAAAIDGYYQQVLQNGMNGMAGPYANMFATPHRPLPFMHTMSNPNAFLPLGSQNGFYPPGLASNSSPVQRTSPERIRSNSISPVASSLSSHSPNATRLTTSPPAQTKPTHNQTDDESDIEV